MKLKKLFVKEDFSLQVMSRIHGWQGFLVRDQDFRSIVFIIKGCSPTTAAATVKAHLTSFRMLHCFVFFTTRAVVKRRSLEKARSYFNFSICDFGLVRRLGWMEASEQN